MRLDHKFGEKCVYDPLILRLRQEGDDKRLRLGI
jgi:hypothetical protein